MRKKFEKEEGDGGWESKGAEFKTETFHKGQSGVTVLLFCQGLKVICQGNN